MPSLIQETVLRITTLMLMEAGENIGVSSKSMPDNSRTFISYTNYSNYLAPLRNYRVEVFCDGGFHKRLCQATRRIYFTEA